MTKRTTQFYLLTLLFLLCTATTALAQRRVEGRVVDNETGETLPGVNLVTRNGTYAVTDEKGTYNLSITRGDSVTVSYVGYEPQTLPAFYLIDHHEIRLKTGAELREVVVTASIASARNAKAVGSKIDKVDVERLMDQGTGSNLADIIDGRISGVQMFQSNGKVGMPIRFNMRSGATLSMDRDPIIYVDGVRYNNSHTSDINTSQDAMSSLNDLPLEDIASIDVIKGPAAAASYGAEAANGVIVITTKRRSSAAADGGNLTGTVKFTQGVNTLARRYTQFVNNDDINNFFVNGNITRLYANLSKRFAPGNQLYFSLDENHTAGIVPGNKDVRHALMAAYDLAESLHHERQPTLRQRLAQCAADGPRAPRCDLEPDAHAEAVGLRQRTHLARPVVDVRQRPCHRSSAPRLYVARQREGGDALRYGRELHPR